MAITVGELRCQTENGKHGLTRAFLYCAACGERNSANSGDYFMAQADHVFKHCGRPMDLCIESKRIVSIKTTRTYTPRS